MIDIDIAENDAKCEAEMLARGGASLRLFRFVRMVRDVFRKHRDVRSVSLYYCDFGVLFPHVLGKWLAWTGWSAWIAFEDADLRRVEIAVSFRENGKKYGIKTLVSMEGILTTEPELLALAFEDIARDMPLPTDEEVRESFA